MGHNQKTVLAITLLAIINLVGAQSLTPNIVCDTGKVTVSPPWHNFELCFDSECQMFHHRNTNMIYYLPISPSNGKVKVDIKDDNGTTVLSENCCRPEFCIDSSKFLSKSLLGNPHCWPVGAILSVAVMLYLTVSVILLICWTSKFLTRSKKRCTSNQIKNNSEADQDESTGMEMINTHGFAPTPLSGRFTVTLLIVLYIANSTSACQHGFLRHTTEMVCDQNGKCGYEIWKELLFNRIQSKYCIEIHRHNKTVGMVSIKLSAVKYTCVKSSMFFTRDTDYHIFSSLRCPEMGSCSAGQCDSLQPNETIPELRGSRKYPGYSACDYTCGGILCGCLLPTPACLFYRVAHIPVSKDVYEVFKCQDWIPRIQVEIRSQLFGVNETKNYTIQPYVESKLSTMNVTVLSIRKPDQPLINRRFAQSNHSTIILPELFRNPVECATRDDARKRFHVCENKIICSCSGGTTPHHCKCPDDAIGHLHRDTSNILPLETAYLRIRSEGQNIVAESHEGELTIAIGSTLFTNSSEFIINEQCDIVLHDLVGCYSCVHGSEVIATCTSQHKNEVLVNCQKYSFTVGCSPDGENTTVRINHDSAIVDEACYVTCGDTTTNLTIKGLLVYHQTANLSVFWHNSQETETEWGDLFDFHLPDLNPLVETIKHHWKMVVALAVATTTLLSLTYFLGPVVIIALFKVLYATLKCLA
ncbi:hypothetical protein Y032_1370g3851, partial [Ancylostoma ceylanicum]